MGGLFATFFLLSEGPFSMWGPLCYLFSLYGGPVCSFSPWGAFFELASTNISAGAHGTMQREIYIDNIDNIDPLIKIQKKIVRIITFSPYLCHTDPIFKDLNLLPISKLVTQRIGLLMFKYSIHSLPSVIEDLFTCNTSVSNHNTRNKSKLRQPRSNSEYMYRNISFTGVYIWNKIQDHINVYSTYSTFKDALKSFLLVHDLNYRIL